MIVGSGMLVLMAGCKESGQSVAVLGSTYPTVAVYSMAHVGPALEGQVQALAVQRQGIEAIVRWTNLVQGVSWVSWQANSPKALLRPIPNFLTAVESGGQLWWAQSEPGKLIVSNDASRFIFRLPAGADPEALLAVGPSASHGAVVLSGRTIFYWYPGHQEMIRLPGSGRPTAMAINRRSGTLWVTETEPNVLWQWSRARGWSAHPLPGPAVGLVAGDNDAEVLVNTAPQVQAGIGTWLEVFSSSGRRVRQFAVPEPATIGPDSIAPWYGGATNLTWVRSGLILAVLWDPAVQRLALARIDPRTGQGAVLPASRFGDDLSSGQPPLFPAVWRDGSVILGDGNGLAFYLPRPSTTAMIRRIMK